MTVIVHDYLEESPSTQHTLVLERRSLAGPILLALTATGLLGCALSAVMALAPKPTALGIAVVLAALGAYFATIPRVERVIVDRSNASVTLASGRVVAFASVRSVALVQDSDGDGYPIYALALEIDGALVNLSAVFCTSEEVVRRSLAALSRVVPEWPVRSVRTSSMG
ncbi:MAG: hypothetical protein JNK05_37385 [Myxococcales bacterium]|nr:hypothetical protein [Myxococcales bacterium]